MQNSFKINVLVKGVARTKAKWYFLNLRQNAASCIEDVSFSTYVQLNIISDWTSRFEKRTLGVGCDFLGFGHMGMPNLADDWKGPGRGR